jgi:hypothetical protein
MAAEVVRLSPDNSAAACEAGLRLVTSWRIAQIMVFRLTRMRRLKTDSADAEKILRWDLFCIRAVEIV